MISYNRDRSTRAGIIGATVILAAVVAVSYYDDLVFLDIDHEITAIFADAGGIEVGDKVELVGVNVGQVTEIALRGTDVEVTMSVRDDLALGEQPRAQMRTRAVLGAKAIVLVPSDDPGRYDPEVPIPLERTRAPYDLPTELGALTANVADIDTDQLSDALRATSEVLAESAPEVHTALDGVARLSDTLGSRDEALKELLRHGSTVSGVLAERRTQLNALVLDGNTLFAAVDARRAALHTLATHLSAVAQQISGLIADNREQLGPALERVNRVLDLLERHQASLEAAIPGLATYARTLNEALGSGPFFQAYITNLLPGQFVQPFIDAALGDGRLPTPPAETLTEGPR
ncbi:MCE family protein [Rhodococcus oxybenzonivorans]|uniref:MCE family protein n=1 Tax=Rhodococcus TaxID=1827 RepID=UPI00131F971A|nr:MULTISPECIES: MCE family protein [Rhodococcus]MDV7355050.1 MCE family protein [Rhodococcus oxybenzonivorans]QHE68989.1 MCE-family protein Mce1C [Rhodococcus sp. WAY2]